MMHNAKAHMTAHVLMQAQNTFQVEQRMRKHFLFMLAPSGQAHITLVRHGNGTCVFKAWVGTLFDVAPVLRDIAPVLRDFALVLRQVSAPQTCQTMRIMVANHHSQRHRNTFLSPLKSFATPCLKMVQTRFPRRSWYEDVCISNPTPPTCARHAKGLPMGAFQKPPCLSDAEERLDVSSHVFKETFRLMFCNLLVLVHSNCP